jgi:hypothetical protein
MDKLTRYKNMVKNMVIEIGQTPGGSVHNLEMQTIIDDQNGQYLLYNNTWDGEKRLYGCFLHLEVRKNGKIWIHHDGTDLIVGEKLLENNVPKQDIVLGFRAPIVRVDSGFAVA